MQKTTLLFLLLLTLMNCTDKQKNKHVTHLKNGSVIFAYKGFEQFLQGKKNWKNYRKKALIPFSSMKKIHQRYIEQGLIDSIYFKGKLTQYSKSEFQEYFSKFDGKHITRKYKETISEINSLLPALEPVDICFFLPYGKDCFVQEVNGRQTIFISLKYGMEMMEKIIIHEYAHCLHFQRRIKKNKTLKEWIIAEGIASYFPKFLSKNTSIYECLWMMPKENIEWCIKNEDRIIDTIFKELDKKGLHPLKRFIAGGKGFSKPPNGFPEKTGYYLGYRIIEQCINENLSIKQIFHLHPNELVDTSNIFIESGFQRYRAGKDFNNIDSIDVGSNVVHFLSSRGRTNFNTKHNSWNNDTI